MKATRIEIEERNNRKHLVIYFMEIPDNETIKECDVNVLDTFTFKMGTTQYEIPIYYRFLMNINIKNLSDIDKKLLRFIENFGIFANTETQNQITILKNFYSNVIDVSTLNQELELEILWEQVKEYSDE
jgi:hypothetical protein